MLFMTTIAVSTTATDITELLLRIDYCCYYKATKNQVSTFLQKMAIAKTIKEQLAIVATTATAL